MRQIFCLIQSEPVSFLHCQWGPLVIIWCFLLEMGRQVPRCQPWCTAVFNLRLVKASQVWFLCCSGWCKWLDCSQFARALLFQVFQIRSSHFFMNTRRARYSVCGVFSAALNFTGQPQPSAITPAVGMEEANSVKIWKSSVHGSTCISRSRNRAGKNNCSTVDMKTHTHAYTTNTLCLAVIPVFPGVGMEKRAAPFPIRSDW